MEDYAKVLIPCQLPTMGVVTPFPAKIRGKKSNYSLKPGKISFTI